MRRWINDPRKDLHELFKRIVFNGLVSNSDDHPRNHGFLFNGKDYNMSPAYDIVPKKETGTERYLAMEFGSKGRIFNLDNLLSRTDAFDLKKEDAEKIYLEIKSKVKKWPSFYASYDLSKKDLHYLQAAFSHWDSV